MTTPLAATTPLAPVTTDADLRTVRRLPLFVRGEDGWLVSLVTWDRYYAGRRQEAIEGVEIERDGRVLHVRHLRDVDQAVRTYGNGTAPWAETRPARVERERALARAIEQDDVCGPDAQGYLERRYPDLLPPRDRPGAAFPPAALLG